MRSINTAGNISVRMTLTFTGVRSSGLERPYIESMLQRQLDIITRKAHDYAKSTDYHSNFRYSEMVADPFGAPYKSYAVLIGIKLARLSELLGGKEPNNESVQDSFDDLANYVALMAERWHQEYTS